MKKVGLTLGKYAPLHEGHQFVFETALSEMDEVIVIIYDTDKITVPLSMRSAWIRKLYPMITVIEAWDGPQIDPLEQGENRELYEKAEEEYVKLLLGDRQITHFYCSEYYGEHMSKALKAVDRRVDEARSRYAISGTKIRNNPYQYRDYISPIVYRDLITKIVFLGAMSTGKST